MDETGGKILRAPKGAWRRSLTAAAAIALLASALTVPLHGGASQATEQGSEDPGAGSEALSGGGEFAPGEQPTLLGVAQPDRTIELTVDGEPDFEYQWLRDGEEIAGATDRSYTYEPVPAGDPEIAVRVTDAGDGSDAAADGAETAATPGEPETSGDGEVSEGGDGAGDGEEDVPSESLDGAAADGAERPWVVLSANTAQLAPTIADASGAPVVSGVIRVGQVLTAQFEARPGYEPTFRWLRNGERRKDAASMREAYTIRSADLLSELRVEVTQTSSSGAKIVGTSAPTPLVSQGILPKLSPRISGLMKVGERLTVTTAKPSLNTALKINWLRDGKIVSSRTGTSYLLTPSDLGKRISVRVSQSKSAYAPGVETSARTPKITIKGTLASTKPRITGTVRAGATLKLKRGSWTSGTKFTYQWYSGGKRIPKATKSSLKLTKAHNGRLIRVKVTGKRTGFYDKAVTSEPASIKGLRGPRNKNGWAWPTDTRKYGYGYHDGYSVDINSTAGGPIYSPYTGVVVKVGGDGGGVPWVCVVNPGWWRGENQTVIIRHKYKGKTRYSSVNHVARGSSKALGIKAGARIKAGQQIATEGMSGCTSAPHNHFLIKKSVGNYWGDVKPETYIGKPRR
ncbi:M23 family metallopeptidase [Leucobacter weissii]|uniref:M23 family metallopeptidase n=1 Tax=Leucobacter weissii TaxID=1983706 RepID=A0A939MIK0_9MICO|nr:M23 family metallopeptidase [Leucobacter weissii]MBO1900675.1 M23 family metallopeptidase [Leucobacter weissii]